MPRVDKRSRAARITKVRPALHRRRRLGIKQSAGRLLGDSRCEGQAEARVLSDRLESILRSVNRSALESYLEAKDDLLAVHELKLSRNLKRFFSTTNAIESLNSMIEEDMRRVKLWRDSEHFQRWLATYCLASEKRMRRIRGHASVAALWVKLRNLTERQDEIDSREKVA